MSGEPATKSDQTRKNIDTVPALRRAVAILNLVAAAGDGISAAEITRQVALPKSTAHGQLNVLTELGLLLRTSSGTFRLGPQLMRWADGFLSQMDVVSIFREYFATDTNLDGYTITLTVLNHDEVVYISCRNSEKPLGHTFRIGMRLPAPFTATGKMLLSQLSEDELTELFTSNFPLQMTPASVLNLEELKKELTVIRERHFSIDNGQIHSAMTCVGAAVYDHSGRAIAGIATSLLSSEAQPGLIENLGEKIRYAAAELSKLCGCPE